MWRCINGEFMLQPDVVKRRYLDTRVRFLKRASGKVRFHSFCLLDNHGHESATLVDDSKHMSNWARSAHSSFGRWLNIRLKRRGPVAQDRPNTVAVEDQEGLKRVMFYGDWNPVRAGICDHPSKYPFSSYRYYAFTPAHPGPLGDEPPRKAGPKKLRREQAAAIARVALEPNHLSPPRERYASTPQLIPDPGELGA